METFTSVLLGLSILAAVVVPQHGPAAASAQSPLFTLAEDDFISPIISSAAGISVLNGAAKHFARFAGYDEFQSPFIINGEPELANMTRYTGELFRLLDMQFLLRMQPARESKRVYISESLWERAFKRDAAAVGTTIKLHDQSYIIAGVTRAFSGMLANTDFWLPISSRESLGSSGSMRVIGALLPGTHFREAQSALQSLFRSNPADASAPLSSEARLVPLSKELFLESPAVKLAHSAQAPYQTAAFPFKRGS